jgi:hypothetical protein
LKVLPLSPLIAAIHSADNTLPFLRTWMLRHHKGFRFIISCNNCS